MFGLCFDAGGEGICPMVGMFFTVDKSMDVA